MGDVPAAQLWQLSATQLASAYRTGLTSPDEVLQATFERIEDVNPRINAIIALDVAGARTAAAASTRRWRDGRPLGPLDGIPLTVKDNILVCGLRATWGSRLYADFVPGLDEEPVSRLRDAGMVIVGKSNVPEFTLHGYTDNLLFGPTRNPWDLALTPGGSSGGGVAAVVSGIGPVALCTDGGGSIRRPAAHTGLVGFKPSRGMVPRAHGFPQILHDFEVAGPVACNVDDIIAVMNAIGGADWCGPDRAASAAAKRVLYIPTFSDAPVDPAIAAAVAEAAAELAEQGHRVDLSGPFDLADPVAMVWPAISESGLAWLLARHGDARGKIAPALAEMAASGARRTAADYVNALNVIRDVERAFDRLFDEHDVLLTPATAAMPWPATQTHPATIAGRQVGPRGHAVFTPFANALGLPAISLPCKSWHRGLPVGFQLVARRGRDAELLVLAASYERHVARPFRWPVAMLD